MATGNAKGSGGLLKLQIQAYNDRGCTEEFEKAFVAQYNPQGVSLGETVEYAPHRSLEQAPTHRHFQRVSPGSLTVELVLSRWAGSTSITADVTRLHEMCFGIGATSRTPEVPNGEPRFLRVTWGDMKWLGKAYFAGRASALVVRYTQFDRKGAPLAASAHLTLMADGSGEGKDKGKSPASELADQSGQDSLPQLAQQAGGMMSAKDYLSLALANDLDSVHVMTPGQVLVRGGRGTS
ncbi:CIS tube protein [Paraburkholderia aspalathi]|uniref:CIS tube protein n=1 Tax=Paraburkholderia aspalathi TaxID=1324617 RepID=UPI0038BDB9F1